MQGGPGLPNPPASKTRALEIKLEKWWKIKIILQVGFVFGFFFPNYERLIILINILIIWGVF